MPPVNMEHKTDFDFTKQITYIENDETSIISYQNGEKLEI